MSNTKQTAVEWLWEQITSGSVPKSNLLQQAKAIEKEQIESGWDGCDISNSKQIRLNEERMIGLISDDEYFELRGKIPFTAEQYYKDTYGE